MIAMRSRNARTMVVVLALILALSMGQLWFATAHARCCGNGSACSICQLLEHSPRLAMLAASAAMVAFVMYVCRRVALLALARPASLICSRIRMDD